MAPFVLDGPINGDSFTAWVGQCLVPTLAPGDIVIADNLGSHKGQPARQRIRKAGAHLLFLRKPRLRPIDFSVAFSGFGGATWGDELVGESRTSSL